MSTCANRTICSFRRFILAPSTCFFSSSGTRISFLRPSLYNNIFPRAREHYHSDSVARFRITRLHGGHLAGLVPNAFKATTRMSDEHVRVASAGSHNNAPDASLSLRLQPRGSDIDNGFKPPEGHNSLLPDVGLARKEATQEKIAQFTIHDKTPHMEVGRNNKKSHGIPLSLDGVHVSEGARQEQSTQPNPLDIGTSGPNDPQKVSMNKFLDIQANKPLSGVRNKRTATARHGSNNRNNASILKLRREVLNAARAGDVRNAFHLYLEFITIGKLDVEMADVLIRALCWGTLKAPPHLRISQALQIYNCLIETEQKASDEIGFFDSQGLPSIEEQSSYTQIYNTLLRALSAPISSWDSGSDVQEQYTKASMGILAAMEARGLVPDNRTVCSILLLRFRNATSHEEAYEFYTSFITELDAARAQGATALDADFDSGPQPRPSVTSPVLDQRGYRMVLNAFAKLSFPNAPVAPGPLWFAIAKDMRERGYVVTVEDYTIYLGAILSQTTSPFALQRTAIGLASSQDEEARMKAMMDCVKHVHRQLTIDVTLEPDATLLNTLMNVYQHLGAFDKALKVFNTIWLSGRMDSITPVIIFDACGHAKKAREATMIWCMFVGRGWQFDKHTLDTWVECLCRLGNVEAACKFVCIYMGRDKAGYSSKNDTQPDVQTCLILLKLSWLVGQNLDVKEKIRTHLPHIWKKLKFHYN